MTMMLTEYAETRDLDKVLVSNPEGGCLEDLGIDGRIMLEWISRKKDGRMWT
jgi:hypothetical protein